MSLIPRDMLAEEFPEVLASSSPFKAACLAHGWDEKQAREVVKWSMTLQQELVRATGLESLIAMPERLNAVAQQLTEANRTLRLVTNGEAA